MTTNDAVHPPLNTPESFEAARGYAGLLGEIPSSFSAAIRSLLNDEEKTPGVISPNVKFAVKRLLKSPSLSASFMGVSQLLGIPVPSQSPDGLLARFSPMECAGLIGMYYIFRRTKSFATEILWDDLHLAMTIDARIGALVGRAIPHIGLTFGLATGLLPRITLCLFEKQDVKAFKEYRRHLMSHKISWDLSFEQDTWGCTRLSVAAILLQTLGFGVSKARAYAVGLSSEEGLGENLSQEEYLFKICRLWIDTLRDQEEEPKIRHRGEYYPSLEARKKLIQDSSAVVHGDPSAPFFFDPPVKDEVSEESDTKSTTE